MHVVVQTDCDLAGQIETRQTTTSLMVFVQGALVHWRASTGRITIPSTAAGEYVTLSRGNTTAKYVNDVLKFYGNPPTSYYLYTDNQAAEHIATQPNMNEHSRSIDTRHHAIRQDYVDGHMRIGGVASANNTSDILTKYLQPPLHEKHAYHLHITQEKRPPKTTLTNCVLSFVHYHEPSTNPTSIRKRHRQPKMEHNNTTCEFPPAFLDLLPKRPTLTKRQKKRQRQQYWNAIHSLRQQNSHLYIMSKQHMTKTPTYHNHCQTNHPRWPRNQPATIVLQRNASKLPHTNSNHRNRFQTKNKYKHNYKFPPYKFTQNRDTPSPRFPELNPTTHGNLYPKHNAYKDQEHTNTSKILPTQYTSHNQHNKHHLYKPKAQIPDNAHQHHFRMGIQFPSINPPHTMMKLSRPRRSHMP
jgi:hypothetical protein